ncbi:unnamed protein product [[Candida] boidinii]|nr:unnamed protein product [[Candida] boidinii]
MQDTYAGSLVSVPKQSHLASFFYTVLFAGAQALSSTDRVLVGRLPLTRECLLTRPIILEIWWIFHQVVVLLAVVGCLTSKTQLLNQSTRLVLLLKAIVKSKVLITKELSVPTFVTKVFDVSSLKLLNSILIFIRWTLLLLSLMVILLRKSI